ncbi:MAG TPA: NADH-quinone oxidoreductase subunit L [Lacunisphaera sp.]|nr:NADH-quinone oxidoreductase subunit L [Lacunisphaera sp.]
MTSAFILLLVPAGPLVAGLASRPADPRRAGRLTQGAAWLALGAALACAIGFLFTGPATIAWTPAGTAAPFAVSFRGDTLSMTMSVLVSWLGAVVLGFSRGHLAGDPNQARFLSWMSLTLAAVLVLVLAGHLLLLLVAWMATSLCLHRLLLFYPERAGARFAARKKFVFSRLGDACLLGAALVLHARHGTFDIATILAEVSAGQTAGTGPAAGLLAACAMLKSAQFPFHSWLPDTMETPTPVSAFMHAGIVNAGGFLVIRLAPVFATAPVAAGLLAVTGAFTAAFGAVVMLAQPSVKRALAYSTIAQMGFMMLQCGLGAYGLALLHLVAHSLYKAHAFLTAGSTVGAVPRAAVPLRTPALTLGLLTGGLCVVLGTVVLQVFRPAVEPAARVFGVILALALAYGLARTWSAGGGWRTFGKALGAALVVALLSLGLHAAAAALFAPVPRPLPPQGLLVAVGGVFAGLFAFQALLWRAGRSGLGRRLYVHALNGFYLGTWFNQLLGRLWPQHPVSA